MTTHSNHVLAGATPRAVAAGGAFAIVVFVAYLLGTGDRQAPQAAQAAAFQPGGAAAASTAGIEVMGTGKIAGTPDVLRLDLGVTTSRTQAADSLSAAGAAITKVTKALRGHGINSRDIKTAGLSLQADYDYNKDTSAIRGYTASEQISVTLRNLRTAGAAIGAAVSAGGDATRVNGLALDLEGDSKLLAQARLAAIADAKSKAEAYAKATGRSLGQVSVVSEDATPPAPISMDRNSAGAMDSADVPVQPGSQQVSVSVRVVWSFA